MDEVNVVELSHKRSSRLRELALALGQFLNQKAHTQRLIRMHPILGSTES